MQCYIPDDHKREQHGATVSYVREKQSEFKRLLQLNSWMHNAVGNDSRAVSRFSDSARATHLVIGNRELQSCLAEIRELRRRCGQEDDLTTEPEYFIAANTLANRRCAAVLIRREQGTRSLCSVL